MGQCKFNIAFTEASTDFIRKAEAKIRGIGGTFQGDGNAGNFLISTPLGQVTGNYAIQDQIITIHITDKPMFIGCGKIESLLNEHLVGKG